VIADVYPAALGGAYGCSQLLEDLEARREEASAAWERSRFTTLGRVILPPAASPRFDRVRLAFARAVGEYGSVVFISGNMPYRTESTPLRIVA